MKILIWIGVFIIAAVIMTVMSVFGHLSAIPAAIIVVLATSVAGGICMIWDNRFSFFKRNIEPSCAYCIFGVSLGHGDIACIKRGIMSVEGRCGAFCYEPTKRKPEYARNPVLSRIIDEDLRI